MPLNNFLLFDQNKANLLTDAEYSTAAQRLNGVQTGVASSQLQNKFSYQMSLMAYALAQLMNANGLDASDALAVTQFVNNLDASVLSKVKDKATAAEAIAAAIDTKWLTPSTVLSFFNGKKATTAQAQTGTDDTSWMSPNKITSFFNAKKASAAEAQAGAIDTKWMSPLQTKNLINNLGKLYIVGPITATATLSGKSKSAKIEARNVPSNYIFVFACAATTHGVNVDYFSWAIAVNKSLIASAYSAKAFSNITTDSTNLEIVLNADGSIEVYAGYTYGDVRAGDFTVFFICK